MAPRPIFCVTHPRACSTAFERIFMTRNDDLVCLHEPFGDAFYYGPERMSRRYERDPQAREESGFAKTTFQTVFDRVEREGSEGKRVFIKDMIYYLMPPDGKPPQLAPSLLERKRGIGTQTNGVNGINGIKKANGVNGVNGIETNGAVNGNRSKLPFPFGTPAQPGNPTVAPAELLKDFHYTFLIRDPHYSIPSYYRCCVPPLDSVTGWSEFYPSEAGFEEVRKMFDYLVTSKQVGPHFARKADEPPLEGESEGPEICVIDADDLLDDPEGIVRSYCRSIGLEFKPSMLNWDNEEDQTRAQIAFEKWKGWHEDALASKDLKPRTHKKARKTEDQFDHDWTQRYGLKGANMIRRVVDENMDTYLYLKQFALTV